MTPRVLIVCYYFPPLGLAGVGRPLNLFRHLPAHGYECDILTVKPITYRAYEPELLEGLDLDKIHRSGSYDPQRLLYLAGMRTVKHSTIARAKPVAERFFPDSKKGWIGPAVRTGSRLLKKIQYAAVISTSPPMSSHIIAQQMTRSTKVPWIADFRDFWSMYRVEDTFSDPTLVARGKELLRTIRVEAAAVTAVNRSITEYLETGHAITNGYDTQRADRWRGPENRDRFVIGVPGNLGEERVIEPLLEVLATLRAEAPEAYERVHLLQLGQVEPEWLSSLLDKRGFAGRYTIYGLQKRDDTIDILSACAAFYVGLTADREQDILPQRLFDLAASGRPILAYCTPESEIAKLVGETGNGLSYTDTSSPAAATYLLRLVKQWSAGELTITPRPSYALPYSANEMARKFAKLLDSIR